MSSTTNRVSDVTQRPSDYEAESAGARQLAATVSFDDVESAPQPQPMPMAVAVEQPALTCRRRYRRGCRRPS